LLETDKQRAVTETTPLEDKFVVLPNGLRAHYVESGPADAPALILTHGFLSSIRDWQYNIVPLAQQSPTPLRVIAVDWPGFGLTDKGHRAYSLFFFSDFLRDFANALNLKDFDLMGHSMGGKHNLAFVILNPGMANRLILVDPDGFIKEPWWTHYTTKWWFQPLSRLQLRLVGSARFLKLFSKTVYHNPKYFPTEETLVAGAAILREKEQVAALRALNENYPSLSLGLTGLRESVKEIKNRTLIVWGKQDKILNISMAAEIHNLLSNSELYLFDNCGHLPMVEYAEEFNKLVLDFLSKN
jgi:4,5:9,10-diseco-3-hydroxy-5,9,17-trioxoandrosta-1(10),2-diene-4-oate hydrolase